MRPSRSRRPPPLVESSLTFSSSRPPSSSRLALSLRSPCPPTHTVALPVPSLSSISTSLARAAALQSRLYLLLSSLSSLRSEYPAAQAHLGRALHIASAYAPHELGVGGDGGGAKWADEVQLRAALGWALMRCARAARDGADEREAERALEAVLDAAASPGASSASPQTAHLVTVARLSLVLLRMSAPPGTLAPTQVTSTDALVRALAASSASASSSASGNSASASSHARLAAALATALTARSITASKAALSQALSLTNQMGATHARAGVLALLGNVFLWTREGEVRRPFPLSPPVLVLARLLSSPSPTALSARAPH